MYFPYRFQVLETDAFHILRTPTINVTAIAAAAAVVVANVTTKGWDGPMVWYRRYDIVV